MTDELKPCPFCGGSVELNNIGDKYYITCFGYGCGAEFKGYEKERMVNHWNTRAISVHSAAVHESAPKDTDGVIVKDYVIRDIKERAEVGKNKYGGYLKTNNGRSSLWDAYQEALDLVMYLRQLILETVEKS